MAAIEIDLTNLTDGVSTEPMSQRSPGSLALATNSMMRRIRGFEKRPGTEIIKTDQADYALQVTNPTNSKFFHWIDRDDDEKFLVVLDPSNVGVARFQSFTLVTRGTGAGTAGNEIAGQRLGLTVTNHPTGGQNPLDYLSLGSVAASARFRALTVTDTTLIANRDIATALSGAAISYLDGGVGAVIRAKTHAQNKSSWNELPQPPTGTAGAGVTTSNFIYFARDDDLGWPAGWYRASSTTQPPWYTRIRTESANSLIDWTRWPIRANFDGTVFVVEFPNWVDRYSGDSFTNPGPQLVTGPSAPHKIVDMCYFQSRLFVSGYEFVDSSQTGDVFNLWNNSYVGITDTDPINISLQSDAVTQVDWLIPFDGGIVALTRGARQFEVRSQGAMTPSTVSIIPTTAYNTVNYCAPAKLGNQLYFMAEQNGSMVLYEYIFQNDRGSNVATNSTAAIEGYIPSRARAIRTSTQNDMLFVLTSGEVNTIFVNQMQWRDAQNTQRAWSKWTFADEVMDCQVFGSVLYIIFKRNSKLYLEKVNIDLPSDDDSSEVPATVNGYSGSGDMGYSIRLDSRATYQGSYNSGTNTTTWTIPYADDSINRVVLGQRWDCDYEFPTGTFNSQRRKSKILTPVTEGGLLTIVATPGVSTVITAPGNFATNGNGDNSLCWIGISFEQRGRINEQFARDPNTGAVYSGQVNLKHLMIRLVRTGNFRVEITPQGRDTILFEYVKDLVGQTSLGNSLAFEEYDEFNLPCLGHANTTTIEFVNDSPYPSRLIGGTFRASFVRAHNNPTRR